VKYLDGIGGKPGQISAGGQIFFVSGAMATNLLNLFMEEVYRNIQKNV
jgi:hypothetical protein